MDRSSARRTRRRRFRMKAADIMSTHLVTATPDTPVAELVRLMSGRDASAVPIVQDGRLVGLVTQADLIRALAGQGAAHTGVIDPDRRIRDAFLALLAQPPWSEAASNPTVVVRDGV